MTTTDFYTPQPDWVVQQYGYHPGNTYWINGYRMFLADHGYWYFVDYPSWNPLPASRPHYRTGGAFGILLKWFGVLSLVPGIGLMFVKDDVGLVAVGCILIGIGFIGTVMAIVDSVRNHPTAWKVGATMAVAAYLVHSIGDDE